ncbi:proteasome subunit alpha [Virgisporangium aurantiacum]|uniref:Proteasome subunit alpha n=1 Tax=Virgisporangium aurantiacum TaxID=175570 RepID=A0A8J3ZMJ0_9ACTN|nr:proteasome subunit alpha [Virgisporangium aurantiacum]GIJ64145.1 proteasome subunit alpha [Virgisporangium aurantiacum]
MAMQFYASPEQLMRDRSEYARKNIARSRAAIVLSYDGGVLLVTENVSTALHKVSEIYDRIGFCAVGRYNEFETLRAFGVRLADLRGYSYDRRDVTGRALANAYAQNLGAIFTDQTKPFEVEICVAEVGRTPDKDELYRITFDGSVQTEPGILVIGGQAEPVSALVRERHNTDMTLTQALKMATDALASVGGEGGNKREIPRHQFEVAVLDRRKSGRTFRRVVGAALDALLDGSDKKPEEPPPPTVAVSPAPAKKDDPAPAPSEDSDARAKATENPGTPDPTPEPESSPDE